MRITDIRETKDNPAILEIVLTATRTEVEEARFHMNVDCQIVKGNTVCDLLDEAARRLDESDSGVDWSRACQLKDLAREIRGEEAVAEQFQIAAKKIAAKEKKAKWQTQHTTKQ